MGDWYEFDIKMIDGEQVSGFSYQNENTGFNEVFVQMTEEQIALANAWQDKANALNEERKQLIKSFIG